MARTRQLRHMLPVSLFALLANFGVGCAVSSHTSETTLSTPCKDEFLSHLAGRWHIERSIRNEIVTNSLEAATVLSGSFLELHMQSTTPGKPYEAIVLVGMDTSTNDYVAHWCDSFGPEYSAVGRGKRVGNTVELVFAYPSGPFYNTWTYDPARDSWSFVGESGAVDGSRRPFARDTVTRVTR